jgi:A/G-specific adenine glycosylase
VKKDLTRWRVCRFREAVLQWGDRQRRPFFWRLRRLQRFELLIVEVLLARTRAESAEPVAKELLKRYPSAARLAAAKQPEIEGILYPLGLQRKRARSLIAAARAIVADYGGIVPKSRAELMRLPYVGRYAANAVVCFDSGVSRGVVDSNVARVFSRYFGLDKHQGKLELAENYWAMAQKIVPRHQAPEFNWSLLDLGACVCKPRTPRCEHCPLSSLGCIWFGERRGRRTEELAEQ